MIMAVISERNSVTISWSGRVSVWQYILSFVMCSGIIFIISDGDIIKHSPKYQHQQSLIFADFVKEFSGRVQCGAYLVNSGIPKHFIDALSKLLP